jgi:ligand-binding SRPBCC domain-containing protein
MNPQRLSSSMYYELTDHFEVEADAAKTWAFFSQAENLPDITPPSLGFRIVTPTPIVLKRDALLDYTIKWSGVRLKWRTLIIDWQPPHTFIDLQIRGPYTLWHHQHTFTPSDDGGIRCEDRVIYKLPFGILARPIHGLIVRKQLLDIFRFRRKVIADRLGWKRSFQEVEIRRLG